MESSKIAGLKGEDVDKERSLLHIVGKEGKYREVSLPAEIAEQMDPSQHRIFFATQSCKASFYGTIRRVTRDLDIQVQGIHCFRSNYAQNVFENQRIDRKSDREAKREVSCRSGHNRVEVRIAIFHPINRDTVM